MKIPSSVWSQLGPVPVKLQAKLKSGKQRLLGSFKFSAREIRVDQDSVPCAQVMTMMHEVAHVMLIDSGVANVLSPEQNEAVCDAVGSYLAGAAIAGRVVFK